MCIVLGNVSWAAHANTSCSWGGQACQASLRFLPSAPPVPAPHQSSHSPTPCQVEAFPLAGMFGLCVAFMAVCTLSQWQLERMSQGRHTYHKVVAGTPEDSEGGKMMEAPTS